MKIPTIGILKVYNNKKKFACLLRAGNQNQWIIVKTMPVYNVLI
jgi:hypothetical protein